MWKHSTHDRENFPVLTETTKGGKKKNIKGNVHCREVLIQTALHKKVSKTSES